MKDGIHFIAGSVAYSTYRMLRAPVVLTISVVAMSLAFLSLPLAGSIYYFRKGSKSNFSRTGNVDDILSANYGRSGKEMRSYSDLNPYAVKKEAINFLPPLLTNRILGYDQLANGETTAFVMAHLKEVVWLGILAAAGAGAYFTAPVLGAALGGFGLMSLGSATGSLTVTAILAFCAVQLAALFGQMLRGTEVKYVPKLIRAETNYHSTITHADDLSHFFERQSERLFGNLRDTLEADMTYLGSGLKRLKGQAGDPAFPVLSYGDAPETTNQQKAVRALVKNRL